MSKVDLSSLQSMEAEWLRYAVDALLVTLRRKIAAERSGSEIQALRQREYEEVSKMREKL